MLDLAGHDGAGDSGCFECVDEPREFAEREPVDADGGIGGGAGVDLRIGLFTDGGDDDCEALGARSIQQQEREPSVAGDESEDVLRVVHSVVPPSPSFFAKYSNQREKYMYRWYTAYVPGVYRGNPVRTLFSFDP